MSKRKEKIVNKFIVNEYYWLHTKFGWEVCQCKEIPHFSGGIGFVMMEVEGTAYDVDDFDKAIHIPKPIA